MDGDDHDGQRPLQFRLTTALGIMAAVSVLFGTLRWLGVPAQASMLILVVLLVSVLVAVTLVVVIAHSADSDDDS
jgi:hypothetical protein